MRIVTTKSPIAMPHITAIEIRFKRKLVEQASGCIEFVGVRDSKGYGRITDYPSKKSVYTHRLAWELAFGSIPDGLCVLHRCDNPPCCNPKHLWLGTNADNNADKVAKGRHHNQKKTHCPQGHPYNEENTRIGSHGSRICKTCDHL